MDKPGTSRDFEPMEVDKIVENDIVNKIEDKMKDINRVKAKLMKVKSALCQRKPKKSLENKDDYLFEKVSDHTINNLLNKKSLEYALINTNFHRQFLAGQMNSEETECMNRTILKLCEQESEFYDIHSRKLKLFEEKVERSMKLKNWYYKLKKSVVEQRIKQVERRDIPKSYDITKLQNFKDKKLRQINTSKKLITSLIVSVDAAEKIPRTLFNSIMQKHGVKVTIQNLTTIALENSVFENQ